MSSTTPESDPTLARFDALEGRMQGLENRLDRLLAILEKAPDHIAMVADTADDYVARAARRGIDTEQRLLGVVDAMERLTEPKTMSALLRLAESAQGLDTAVMLAEKLDDHTAMAADMFDNWAARLAHRGVDIEARTSAALDALEALSEPKTVQALTKLAESAEGLETATLMASKLDDHMAMAADMFDDWAYERAERGIDIEDRMRMLGTAMETLTEPKVVEVLTLLAKNSETLLQSGVLTDDTLTALVNIGSALPKAASLAPQPLGLWGLIQAMGRPEVQRAAGLGIAIAAEVGSQLDQPAALLNQH